MSTMASFKAEQKHRKQTAAAQEKWRKAVKTMGLPGIALRSGGNVTAKAKVPGRTLNALIREYQGRAASKVAEQDPALEPDDLDLLDGIKPVTGFPSDPRNMLIRRTVKEVREGKLTRPEIEKRVRIING